MSHLDLCRTSSLLGFYKQYFQPPVSLGSSLLPNDRYLVSQLGVALLKLSERNKEWNSGYVILHHLHRYGIHYVKLSQPPSPLPPLVPHPPSPCSVALTALNLCLHLDKETKSALEVMRGCDWVGPSDEVECDYRTEMLAALGQRCLDENMLEEVWQCLEAIISGVVAKKFVYLVTNLHNKLLQGILNSKNDQFALQVYRSMKNVGLQCLPSVFSSLLQTLCDTDQVGVV